MTIEEMKICREHIVFTFDLFDIDSATHVNKESIYTAIELLLDRQGYLSSDDVGIVLYQQNGIWYCAGRIEELVVLYLRMKTRDKNG